MSYRRTRAVVYTLAAIVMAISDVPPAYVVGLLIVARIELLAGQR